MNRTSLLTATIVLALACGWTPTLFASDCSGTPAPLAGHCDENDDFDSSRDGAGAIDVDIRDIYPGTVNPPIAFAMVNGAEKAFGPDCSATGFVALDCDDACDATFNAGGQFGAEVGDCYLTRQPDGPSGEVYYGKFKVTGRQYSQSNSWYDVTWSSIGVCPCGPPPTAEFEVTATYDLIAFFQDTSTDNPSSRSWDFGAGSSTSASTAFFFPAAGTFPVELTATNASGSDSITRNVTVAENDPSPTIDGSLDLDQDGTVDLLADPTGDCGPTRSFRWILQGGAKLGSPNGVSDYRHVTETHIPASTTASGPFCMEEGLAGLNDTRVIQTSSNIFFRLWTPENDPSGIRVEYAVLGGDLPDPPTTDWTSETYDLIGLFRDASTGETAGQWFWEFGDGNTSTQTNPSHYYQNDGTYEVCLTPSNIGGDGARVCRNVVVAKRVQPQSAPVGIDLDDDGQVDLQAQASGDCGAKSSFRWLLQNGATSGSPNGSSDYRAVDATDVVLPAAVSITGTSPFCIAEEVNGLFDTRLILTGAGSVVKLWTPENDPGVVRVEFATVIDPPGFSKAFTPSTIFIGGVSTLSFTIDNTDGADVTGLDFTDTFPAALAVADPPNASTTCTGGTLTAPAGGGTVTYTGGSLPAGASCEIQVDVTTATSGSHVNTTGELSSSAGSSGTAAATLSAVTPADLVIDKSDGQATAVPGTQVTYTITVTNDGPGSATDVLVTDVFPAALVGVTYSSTTIGSVSGHTVAGSGAISDTLSITPGSRVIYTATGTIAPGASGMLVNTATVSSSVDPDTSNNSSSDSDALTPQADLSISKTDGQTTAVPGEAVSYTIVVTNLGPSDVSGAAVSDVFPAELGSVTYTSTTTGSVSGNTADGSGAIDDTVNISAGGTITYVASGTIASGATGSLINTATVSSAIDPDTSDNSSSDSDSLTPRANLSIEKDDGQTSAVPGEAVIYTIVVTNNGPSDVTGAVVSDVLPPSLIAASYGSQGFGTVSGNTTAGNGEIDDTVEMTAGSSLVYELQATIDPDATGSLINTATVASVIDPDTSDNDATDDDTLTPQADLRVTKTESVETVQAGSGPMNLTYVVTLTNLGPSSAVDVDVAEALLLPPGATVDSITPGTASTYNAVTRSQVSGPFGDSVTAPSLEFARDLSSGAYVVSLRFGDDLRSQNASVSIESGAPIPVSLPAGAFETFEVPVTVTDGQLNVTVDGAANWAALGITVSGAGTPLHQYDFGTAISPLEPGFTQVSPADLYETATGFGWLARFDLGDGTWNVPLLAAGESETLTVVLTVDETAAEGIDLVGDTATVSAATTTLIDTGDDSATELTSIACIDTDGDDLCNFQQDADDDNDGVADGSDSAPLDPRQCADVDLDLCDDCSLNPTSAATTGPWPTYTPGPDRDGPDTDGDGACDDGDPDDDNDGADDALDGEPADPQRCLDGDLDGCDDCSQNPAGALPWLAFTPDPTNDGPDADGDALCDAGDGISLSTATRTYVVGTGNLFRQNVYEIAPLSTTIQLVDGFLPATTDLDALDRRASGDLLFSVRSSAVISSGGQPLSLSGNVIYRFGGGLVSVELDPATIGIGLQTLNALDELGDGSYAISVDTTEYVNHAGGAAVLRPWQVWRLRPLAAAGEATLELLADFGPLGLTNIDGIDLLPDGRMAVSNATRVFAGLPGLFTIWPQDAYIWDGATLIRSFDGSPWRLRDMDGLTLIEEELPPGPG